MPRQPENSTKRVTVTILGEDYVMAGGESEDYMQSVARVVDQRLSELTSQYPKLPVSKIAILTALTFADEYHRLRREHEELMRSVAGAR